MSDELTLVVASYCAYEADAMKSSATELVRDFLHICSPSSRVSQKDPRLLLLLLPPLTSDSRLRHLSGGKGRGSPTTNAWAFDRNIELQETVKERCFAAQTAFNHLGRRSSFAL
jgi:hypothetical protein